MITIFIVLYIVYTSTRLAMNSKLNTFTIKSWNINTKQTQMIDYILGGNERDSTSIVCLQEFSWDNNPKYQKYLKLRQIGDNCYQVRNVNKVVVGVFSYNMGMASTAREIPRTPKYEAHGTLIIWNPNVFCYIGVTEPSYHSLVQDELGHRSTYIVTLATQDMRFLNVMCVHGHATNSNKKDKLFQSIFNQINSCNIPTIVCGDFNYNPTKMYPLFMTTGNLVFNPVNGITHVNSDTGETYCIDHVVHNQLVTVSNLRISGIDQQTGSIKNLMQQQKHDHGILSFQITF